MDIPSGEWYFSLADALVLKREKLDFHKNLRHFMSYQKFYFLEEKWAQDIKSKVISVYSEYFDSILDRLNNFKNATTYIVHNSDATYSKEKVCKWLDENPQVTLYAQNLTFNHDRAFVLPIGQANSMWNHGNKEVWKHTLISPENKNVEVLLTHCSVTNSGRFNLSNLNHSKITKVGQLEYTSFVNVLSKSKFVICPPGNGPDTHRLWETLGASAVPIVLRTSFIEQLVRTLPTIPLVIVDSYNEINFDTLDYTIFKEKFYPKNMYVDKKYWESRIRDTPIVFVHIGRAVIPSHTFDNIENTRLWNPTNKIVLITDKKDIKFKIDNFEIIDTNMLPITQHHLHFQRNTQLDNSFREGFWRATTERVFYLYSWMKKYQISSFLHLENDTLLYSNINEELKDYIGYNSDKKFVIATMGSKEEHLINVFACNDVYTFETFCSFLNSTSYGNEMNALWKFQQAHKDQVSIFPGNPEDEGDFIMDAAPIGQYLGGPDPRNLSKPEGTMSPGFVNQNARFNTSLYKYEWKKESNHLSRLYMNDKKVLSLHIHCKVLHPFRSDQEEFVKLP
jgi:hypothetical protein